MCYKFRNTVSICIHVDFCTNDCYVISGIALLESLCVRGTQLENPTDDPRHQWAPPSTTIPREPRPVGSAPITSQAKSGYVCLYRQNQGMCVDIVNYRIKIGTLVEI